MTKLKIIWICHFSNDEFQKKLNLWRKKNEFAPWIPNMLKGFENREDIEMHVILPHEYLKKKTTLLLRNINYHVIPCGMPIWHRHWPHFFRFDVFSNFLFFRKRVKKVITQIKPDLINLIGAENAYYSSSILDFKSTYPVLITIQGFISQMMQSIKSTPLLKKGMDVEIQILKSFRYYAGEQDSSTYIETFNPNHTFFKLYGPINEVLASETKDIGKKYDCIYFGRLTKLKGVEDFIKVIAQIKSIKPDVKACILGSGDLNPLISIAKDLNCSNNIEFIGFVKTQKELFEIVKSAKVFLAPPYFERLPMTIRETMFLKVPIVAYETGGIPYINRFGGNIYIVKTGDYQEMANKTLFLLESEELRNNLSEKAFKYAIQEFSLNINTERIISAYKTIISENKL